MAEEQPRGLRTTPHSTRLRRRKTRKASLKIFSDGSFMGRKLAGGTTLGFLKNAPPSPPPPPPSTPPSFPPSSSPSPPPQLHHLSSVTSKYCVSRTVGVKLFHPGVPSLGCTEAHCVVLSLGTGNLLLRAVCNGEHFSVGAQRQNRPRGPAPL